MLIECMHQEKKEMINQEMCFKTTTIGLNSYLLSSDDKMLKLVLRHEKKKKVTSFTKESRKFKPQLNMAQKKINKQQKLLKLQKR